ncbi:MAG TPA: flagellar basal body rod modification protein [Eubacteriaceae bacterium]|jgi:flagellar basal-body rod modification protein FlgD|nr:flagellar basal body rod modification protein [Eubacteriaceae bacterium]
MAINGVGGNINTKATTQTEQRNDFMDVQSFLKIMTAQLQNLDPMGENSADSGEYISQMAQFTMLEQMNSLASSLQNLSVLSQQQLSFSLVGKTATVYDGDKEVTGIVEKVRYSEGYAYPVIGGREYSMGMVTEVGED